MAVIKPFQAIRPASDMASRVAALPYDVYNREEAKQEVLREPFSFLKIDRAETQFEDDVDTYDARVYQKAAKTLQQMLSEGVYTEDSDRTYYIYQLTMEGRTQTGLVACASIDDYQNQVIKKHENTRKEKEMDRIHHVDVLNAQTGPIFLAYRSQAAINAMIEQTKLQEPIYDFVSPDEIRHTVWKMIDEEMVSNIQDAFSQIQEIYIADGHHRAASAVAVGKKRREQHPDYRGDEEFNFFLSVLFPDDQLKILPYNRCVRDLNGMTKVQFLEKLSEVASLQKVGEKAFWPSHKGEMAMFFDNQWYLISFSPQLTQYKDAVKSLDVSILQDSILHPILEIGDPREDDRLYFVGGIRGLEELERRVHSDCQVAFAMYPTSITELFGVADAKRLMPPKSTWFEPKLRSGLFIHVLGNFDDLGGK